jgi:hypothetical protein
LFCWRIRLDLTVSTKKSFSCPNKKQSFCALNTKITILMHFFSFLETSVLSLHTFFANWYSCSFFVFKSNVSYFPFQQSCHLLLLFAHSTKTFGQRIVTVKTSKQRLLLLPKKIISDSFECYFCFVLIMILTFTSSVLNKINWGIYYTSTGNAHLICPKPVCLQNETVSCEVVSKIFFPALLLDLLYFF